MIDETNGIINLTYDEVQALKEMYGIDEGVGYFTITFPSFPAITATALCVGKHCNHLFNEEKQPWYINVKINWIELLKKNNLDEADIKLGYLMINDCLSLFCDADYKDILLESMEYSRDVYVEDANDRKTLLALYHKAIDKRYHMRKFGTYETTVYHLNDSQKLKVYDKSSERHAKGFEPMFYEINAIRFECVLKKRHFYYKYHHDGILMAFDNYLAQDMYRKYMMPFIDDLYFTADYHDIQHAESLICSDEGLKQKDKEILHKFISDVSKNGLLSLKKDIGYYRYRKNITLLNQINVNPIVIDDDMGISNLKNPISGIIL